MNKKEFLNRINYEDKVLLSNIYDKIMLYEKINRPIYFNEFYPPNVWKALTNISHNLGCKIGTYGVLEDSDRRVISILPPDTEDNTYEYPVCLIKINNKSAFKNLKHSDFLGALMGQGIKREKFGDLILEGQSCFVPICNDIYQYIKDNLDRVGKNPCSIEMLEINDIKVPKFNFEKKTVTVSSLRIDCVVSSLSGVSRNSSVDMIKSGMILLDYEKIVEKDTYVKLGSIVTIRGYGKFKIMESIGKTQREREKIIIKKYI